MKKIIGFINEQVITKVDSMSNNYILYYSDNCHDYKDIRICNISKNGKFFDVESGDQILSIVIENEFNLVNESGKSIFESKNQMSDEELILQFGIIDYELNRE